jgi:hypothetical protein
VSLSSTTLWNIFERRESRSPARLLPFALPYRSLSWALLDSSLIGSAEHRVNLPRMAVYIRCLKFDLTKCLASLASLGKNEAVLYSCLMKACRRSKRNKCDLSHVRGEMGCKGFRRARARIIHHTTCEGSDDVESLHARTVWPRDPLTPSTGCQCRMHAKCLWKYQSLF